MLIKILSLILIQICGFFNILEICRKYNVKNLIYASTSSIYGKKVPFDEKDSTDFPIQFYAATKKSNEVMAYSYFKMYGINSIGLRFFTVYGSWADPICHFQIYKIFLKENLLKFIIMGSY